jgi:hypothetical protein
MNELEKEFVPCEIALELKELGFDKPCLGRHYTLDGNNWKFADNEEYNNIDEIYDIGDDFTINAPTFSQSFRFFREKYNYHHTITLNKKYVSLVYSSIVNFSIDEFDTYEEAELESIKQLIKLAKN